MKKSSNIERRVTLAERTLKLIVMRNKFLDSLWGYYLFKPYSKKWKRIEKCLDKIMKERLELG